MRLPSLALLACLLAGPAATQDATQHGQISGFHGAMQAMQEQMGQTPTSGDPDVDFAAMMIPHYRRTNAEIFLACPPLRWGPAGRWLPALPVIRGFL